MFREIRDIVRERGVGGLASQSIAYVYRHAVRPYIPARQPLHLAGIPICHDRKWGDSGVPMSWVASEAATDDPHYEAALVAGLTTAIKPGDSIVIVGAGLGVTAVIA